MSIVSFTILFFKYLQLTVLWKCAREGWRASKRQGTYNYSPKVRTWTHLRTPRAPRTLREACFPDGRFERTEERLVRSPSLPTTCLLRQYLIGSDLVRRLLNIEAFCSRSLTPFLNTSLCILPKQAICLS